ncbi:hypothetical protein [Rhizobium binxianense]
MIRTIANLSVFSITAVLCYFMQTSKPHYIDLVRTVPIEGKLGERIEGRFFTAKADNVQFARSLRVEQNRTVQTLSTRGIWAVVTVEVEATAEPIALYRRTWNGPAGLVFDESGRVAAGLPTDFVAGLAGKGHLVFEILPDQARDAEIRISRDWMTEFDNELRIDLDKIELQPDGQPVIMETLDLRRSLEG